MRYCRLNSSFADEIRARVPHSRALSNGYFDAIIVTRASSGRDYT